MKLGFSLSKLINFSSHKSEGLEPKSKGLTANVGSKKVTFTDAKPSIKSDAPKIEPRQQLLISGKSTAPLPTSKEFRQELGESHTRGSLFLDPEGRALCKELDHLHKLMSSDGKSGSGSLESRRHDIDHAFESLSNRIDSLISQKSDPLLSQLNLLKAQVQVEHETLTGIMDNAIKSSGEGKMPALSNKQLTAFSQMLKAGYPMERAQQLVAKGVAGDVAMALKDTGVSFERSLELGPHIKEARAFRDLSRLVSLRSLTSRSTPEDIGKLCSKPFCKVVTKLAESGDRLSSAGSLLSTPPKLSLAYIKAGLTSFEHLSSLRDKGVSPSDVASFVRAGVTDPVAMVAYKGQGISPSSEGYKDFAKFNIGPEEVERLRNVLGNRQDTEELLEAAFSKDHSHPPLTPYLFREALKNGLEAEDLQELRRFCPIERLGIKYTPGLTLSVSDAAAAKASGVPFSLAAFAIQKLGFTVEEISTVLRKHEGDVGVARQELVNARFQIDLERMGLSEDQLKYNDKSLGFSSRVLGNGAVNVVREMTYEDGVGVFKAEGLESKNIPAYGKVLGTGVADGKQSARNVATGLTNDLLGFGVIGKVNYATHQGRVGVVLEKSEGVGMRDADIPNDPSLKGQFRKQLVDLQIVDILTAQMDRHYDNILINVTEKGVQVSGIDNDGSFGTKVTDLGDYMSKNREINLTKDQIRMGSDPNGLWSRGYPPVVDTDQYNAVMNLNPEQYEKEIAQHLGSDEASAARSRLEKFQEHLKSGQVKILKPEGEGTSLHEQWGKANLIEMGYHRYNSYLVHRSEEKLPQMS